MDPKLDVLGYLLLGTAYLLARPKQPERQKHIDIWYEETGGIYGLRVAERAECRTATNEGQLGSYGGN